MEVGAPQRLGPVNRSRYRWLYAETATTKRPTFTEGGNRGIMNNPNQTLIFKEEDFREWLGKNTFAKSGDSYEQKYHGLVLAGFRGNETFWRCFVVPLTNRINADNTDSIIHFREGVDDRLQFICGANYSLFVHLAMAEELINNWTDGSLDGIYARLASSLDVFEALVIQFYLLMNECQGMKSKAIEELQREEFLKLAAQYYDEKYPELHKYYIAIGKKVPPILVPTKVSILEECFVGHPKRAEYFTVSGQIRTLRNAIVHDVRVGMLRDGAEKILIPKPSAVPYYRQWSKVLAVASNHAKIGKDFCEVKTQCWSDLQNLKRVINELYGTMLERFENEFYSKDRSALRNAFGIKFQINGGGEFPVTLPEPQSHKSASYGTNFPGWSGQSLVSGTNNTSRQ